MDDLYLTIAADSHIEIKVKGSRFIGEAFLVGAVDEALEKLQSVRKREYAATHHCYAYVVGLAANLVFKYSDDGEPNGTAGKPICDVVCGHGITNVLVVVTRYFGGTKLGTGGLVRAYGDAAGLAVEKAGLKKNYLTDIFSLKLDFKHYDSWMRVVNRLKAGVLQSDFSDMVTMKVQIRKTMAEDLKAAFTELTAGKGEIYLAGQ